MEFLRSIQKCPPKGEGTIVDIGANIGIVSIGALHNGELEKAIAIEPDPQNFSLLKRNVNQNGLRHRVICLPYAVSHQKGDILFELSDTNFGDHRVRTLRDLPNSDTELYHESERRAITIQSDKLDSLLSDLPESFTRTIALFWVDVQGYEGYVFMGAGNLLSRGIPVNCEIWPYGIKRAGMSQEQFCGISSSIWSHYCVLRRGRFVRYPINMFDTFFDELGDEGDYENVIFIQQN
jgi:FkbM family methyltransferase